MMQKATSTKRRPADLPAPAEVPQGDAPSAAGQRAARNLTQEVWPIERIRSNTRNARKHPKGQIEQLRASLKEYGQVHPLLVGENETLISGHGRLEAMKHEGFTEARVIVARGWTEPQCRSFAILDNKTALNSEWDEDLLAAELKDLELAGVDLEQLGFNDKELGKLLPEEPATNAGEAGAGGAPMLRPVIQFNIVFDDEIQQAAWFAFIKRLKLQYPDKDLTTGARLAKFMSELPAALPVGQVGNAAG